MSKLDAADSLAPPPPPAMSITPNPPRKGSWFFGYASLGRGFLSGAVRSPEDFAPGDQRRDMPRFQGENFARNLELVDTLVELAGELDVAPAQLALAWWRRSGKASPIAGATLPSHIDDAQNAISLHVPAGVWQRIDAVFPLGAAAGQRYSASAMAPPRERPVRIWQ